MVVHCCNHKFWVADFARTVYVDFVEHLVYFFGVYFFFEIFLVAGGNFGFLELAISVYVDCLENLINLTFFFVCQELICNKITNKHLELGAFLKIPEIIESFKSWVMLNSLIDFLLGEVQPWVAEGFLSSWPFARAWRQKGEQKVLSCITHFILIVQILLERKPSIFDPF